jgi:SAM-dependent methyltransferase
MTARAPRSSYVHGSEPAEQERLTRLNELMNAACLRELRLGPSESVLDAGCGLGQFTRDMARGRHARVLGVERDARQLAEARRQAADAGEAGLVEFRQGDVLDLPLRPDEERCFDVAFARFILEHLPDPLRAVRELFRAVRPGGRIVLADDDHDVLHLWPQPRGFDGVWRAYMATYDRAGNDALIGRKLVAILHEAGARPVRAAGVFFGACAGQPEFPVLATNLLVILQGAKAAILATELVDSGGFDRACDAVRAWAARPDSALWYTMCWAEGLAPP